jgi:hypothetical protein
MISQIAYYSVGGLPVVAYLGMVTLAMLISTAAVGFLNFGGNTRIPFRWHPRLAAITIALAFIHALFAVSIYLKF